MINLLSLRKGVHGSNGYTMYTKTHKTIRGVNSLQERIKSRLEALKWVERGNLFLISYISISK